jgi:hypothetical protein
MAIASAFRPVRRVLPARLEWWSVWLLGFGGGIVFIEPSPYELMLVANLGLLLLFGARLPASSVPMLVLLALYNFGGLISLLWFLDDVRAVLFIGVSVYLAVSSAYFAMLVQENALVRLHALKWGYIYAAVLATGAGIVGYFDIAGTFERFTTYGRASGTFKDPNVLGAFIVLPIVFLVQDLITDRRLRMRTLAPLGIILLGLLLSFSRGAWGHTVASLALMTAMTFLLVAGPQLRLRIVVLSTAGAVAAVLGLVLILSIDEVRQMFEIRASLSQDYDVGTTGRFGKQLLAIPELLGLPNGYGPLQFHHHWQEDPHNVYVNAFASYGWLGGLAYVTLTLATLVIGWKTVATPSPVQPFAIAVWSTLFVLILIGFIIDTDHWRHYYMLLGLIWGLYAVTLRSPRESPASVDRAASR